MISQSIPFQSVIIIDWFSVILCFNLITQQGIVICGYHVRKTGWRLPCLLHGDIYQGFTRFSTTSCNHNHTIGSPHPINSGCRSIFKNGNCLYLPGIQRLKISFHTIDQGQRLLAIDSAPPSNVKLHGFSSRNP